MRIRVEYYIEYPGIDRTTQRTVFAVTGMGEITANYVKIWGTSEFPKTSIYPEYIPWHRIHRVTELDKDPTSR